MNKNQEHSQQVFIRMRDTYLVLMDNCNPIATYEELADALNRKGLTNTGQPITMVCRND
jgi:hypothetical protein